MEKKLGKPLTGSHSEAGLSLVEAMVTAAIVAGIALTMATMMNRMSKTNATIKNQVSMTDLERRLAAAVANPRLILASAFRDNTGAAIQLPPSVDGNICAQVDAEQTWKASSTAGVKVLNNNGYAMMNPQLSRCIDDSRSWLNSTAGPNGTTLSGPKHLTDPRGNCSTIGGNPNPTPGTTVGVSIQPVYDDIAPPAKDCFDSVITNRGWQSFLLYDESGQELTGFYTLDGRLGARLGDATKVLAQTRLTNPTLSNSAEAAQFPLLVQAFYYAQCPLENGGGVSSCVKADTINTSYSIMLTKDGMAAQPAGSMPMKNRGLGVKVTTVNGAMTFSNAIAADDTKFLIPVNAIAAKKGGSGGQCDPNTEMAQADPNGTGIKCVSKDQFFKSLAQTCLEDEEWKIDSTGKGACVKSTKINSCRTVEAPAIGKEAVQICYQKQLKKSRPWFVATSGNCSASSKRAEILNELQQTYGTNLITPTPEDSAVRNTGSDTANICGASNSNCSNSAEHGPPSNSPEGTLCPHIGTWPGGCHSVCSYVSGTKTPYDYCKRGAKCANPYISQWNPSDAEVRLHVTSGWKSQAIPVIAGETFPVSAWKECWFNYEVKKNAVTMTTYSRYGTPPLAQCPTGGSGQWFSETLSTTQNSARAAIELADPESRRLFMESDVLTFTQPVCDENEEAVSGGGSCPNGKVALSKRYGGFTAELGNTGPNTPNTDSNPYPRNWMLGCLGVKDVLDKATQPNNPFPLKISAQCCKNGKTNSKIDASGPDFGGQQFFLTNSNHPIQDCTKAGGTVASIGSIKVCKFAGSACPNNPGGTGSWAQYPFMQSWTARTCQAAVEYGSGGESSCNSAGLTPQDGILPASTQFGLNPGEPVPVRNIGPALSSCSYFYTQCEHQTSDRTEIGCI